MLNKHISYGGLARLINTLESEQEIKQFMNRYTQWYIKELKLPKEEAENRVKLDLNYFMNKFIHSSELKFKIQSIISR